MKVAFLVPDLQLSGGIATIVRHAAGLRARNIDADLVLTRTDGDAWEHASLASVPVRPLAEAREEAYDVALATWWETTAQLFHLRARRYAYFVQSLEDRFYDDAHMTEAFAASLTYDLPVTFVTEARWIVETLRAIRPDAPCFYIRNGVDKDSFAPVAEVQVQLAGPLRILIEGRPEVWFKGVGEAIAATQAMEEPRRVTLVAPAGTAADGIDEMTGSLNVTELAEVYRRTDVVLKLSRVEGMYGPPIEGFHLGATCVTTPVTGHDEYVVHGWNGLVVDWDDVSGSARALDLLARDRRLLHFLRSNATATARAWPSWDQSTEFLALALGRIATDPQPRAAAPARVVERVRVELIQSRVFSTPPAAVDLRAALRERMWARPAIARMMRVLSYPPVRVVLRPLARRVLR